MSLPSLRRWSACRHDQSACQLPAPGSFPAARPQGAVVIFVVVLVVLVWLLAHGYSAEATLRIVAAAGALTVTITSQLAAPDPGGGRGLSRI